MINNFCQNLKFDFDLDTNIISQIQKSHGLSEEPDMINIDHCIDKKMLETLNQLGLGIQHADVFYIPAGKKLPIHIDGGYVKPLAKINWVFGKPGSKMIWYKSKGLDTTSPAKKTPTGTNYLELEESNAEIIFSAEITKTALVETGTYHSVDNCTDAPRWCISFILCSASTKERLSFIQAKMLLEKFIA